jgi:peptidyl-dipeptidase A
MRPLALILLMTVLAGCSGGKHNEANGTATLDEARQFLTHVNETLKQLGVELGRAGWAYSTNINPDTEAANAKANQAYIEATARFAKEATRFDAVTAPGERRQLDLLKLALVIVTPEDLRAAEELTRIASSMEGTYGRSKWCPGQQQGSNVPEFHGAQPSPVAPPPPDADPCLDVEAITQVMAESRDPNRLREVWEGWHTIAPPMKQDFARYVELANTGARELGFADTGAMWRAKYDMPPDDFTRELDRLWDQVRPLYVSLHAYVRMKLREKYGDEIPARGPLPAHLLGNIWAQDWSNVFPLVSPPTSDPGYDLTAILTERKMTPVEMVQSGERFFTSLGFAPLPPTFYERSLFTKPPDREVVCHASAWSVDLEDDLRIKMCIDPTAEDFTTIHHELGHNFYQRAYKHLPVLFRDSANDGFHEAVGDTIGLSVTPEYLVRIGLLDRAPDSSRDIGLLLQQALGKIAFLPFGLLIDQWRWQVFSGQVTPDQYNQAWWDLRLKYQGVAPPAPRGEQYFDPGAKYHVPANYPYTRYFLAHILQFQFHRALAQTAGCTGPLHRCSIYESRDAGQRLNAMLELGMSRPWPEALAALTGSRQMDATAIRDYFAPLQAWLDQQIEGQPVGW